jgi:hypothetical protein
VSSDYLWDGTGEPEADVQALERALAPLRHRGAPLTGLHARDDARRTARREQAVGRTRFTWQVIHALSAAATVALVVYAAWTSLHTTESAWQIATVTGTPRVNDEAVQGTAPWRVGDRLETDAASAVEIAVGLIGNVEVKPNSRLTLLRARTAEHRVALDEGSIRAVIWAPPGLFFVDTPSAVAVDLGCAYTLDVAADGSGLLRVEHGWVGFRDGEKESFIPQGALCATRRGRGPGTPYYEDAPAALVSALLAIDFGDPRTRPQVLASALAHARARDALSLWHLLSRTSGNDRARVFERLSSLAPPPASVSRAGVLAGDRRMLDAWWDTLGLDSASWWRMWQRPWGR